MNFLLALDHAQRLSTAAHAMTMSTNDLMQTAAALSQRLSDEIEEAYAQALQLPSADESTYGIWDLGEQVYTVAARANMYASKSLWLIEQLAEQLHSARTELSSASKVLEGWKSEYFDQIDCLFIRTLKNQVMCEEALETTAALVRTSSIFCVGEAQSKAGPKR